MSLDDVNVYLSGEKLYGDDLCAVEVEKWFSEEKRAYYDLTAKTGEKYSYSYHALNACHGFRYLLPPPRVFERVLGVGSAFGDEFRPLLRRIGSITILEPAPDFTVDDIEGRPVKYVEPLVSGEMPFSSGSFDLVTCLSVLHHIPSVTKAVHEIFRCVAPGGYLVLREPIVSMGDWRYPRRGLTKNERGIPLDILRQIVRGAGFKIIHEARCVFPVTARLNHLVGGSAFNSRVCVTLDAVVCRFPWSRRYHATKVFHKFRPWAGYFTLQRPD